ncbi:MAG: ArsR family transcriptional regulator [Capsulimonas sp.]|nr:ArsR family transcriptional regulator [Capsulimonas sp.]
MSITLQMNQLDITAMFKALGDPTRLRIFEFLRACGAPVAVEESGDVRPLVGPTVGDICCHVTGNERVTSSISFHLKELRLAGLITMERRGKNMICSVNPEAIVLLAQYFGTTPSVGNSDCC